MGKTHHRSRVAFRNPAVREKQWQRRNLSNRENTQSERD
nr:MAG TPA: hypothetical protein [Caudoviricetes sp.]